MRSDLRVAERLLRQVPQPTTRRLEVGIAGQTVFIGLEKLRRLTDQVADLPLADRAMSLANVEVLADEDGRLTSVPLAQTSSGKWPRTPQELDELRARALQSPFVAGSLLAEDASALMYSTTRPTSSSAT